MENKNGNGIAAFFKGKGFYAALTICIVAAGVASWAVIGGTVKKLEAQDPIAQISEGGNAWNTEETGKEQENVKVIDGSSAAQNGSSSSQPPVNSAELPVQQPALNVPQTASFILPAEGEVLTPFSGDELVYNDTLADWRTHNGVDISAARDTAVKAAAAGEITKVYTDVLWGTVVEQTSGDLTLRYAGMNAEAAVKIGDKVSVGQTLGRTGESAVEEKLAPHLHFEVLKGSVYQNPLDLVK